MNARRGNGDGYCTCTLIIQQLLERLLPARRGRCGGFYRWPGGGVGAAWSNHRPPRRRRGGREAEASLRLAGALLRGHGAARVGLGDGQTEEKRGRSARWRRVGAESGPACRGGWNAKHVFRVAPWGEASLLAAITRSAAMMRIAS